MDFLATNLVHVITRLESILRSWEHTPWQAGQCCRGRAVDCRYFVIAVLDELYGINQPLPPRLPNDTATNNRPTAIASIRQITSRYPCEPLINDPEPGDVLIVRPAHAHPETYQHATILGDGGRLWHAGQCGVAYTSLNNWAIAHAFRPLEKHRW